MRPKFRHQSAKLVTIALLTGAVLSIGGQVFGQDAPTPNFVFPQGLTTGEALTRDGSPTVEAPTSVPTETWAVQVQPGSDPNALAARLGYVNEGQIANLPDTYLFVIPNTGLRISELEGQTVASLLTRSAEQTDGRAVEIASAALRTAPEIVWYEHQYAREGQVRVPSDPLYPNQWHLNHTGQVTGGAGNDANVLPVWNMGYDGTGVNISIVDEGMEHTHPDLSPNYIASASWDWNQNDSNPTPTFSNEGHGTSAGGVAAAADDGSSCGVGAAYNAGLSSQRILAGPKTDAMEANALGNQPNVNHIYNNSWGPPDNGVLYETPGPLLRNVFINNTASGRSGYGSLYVWAAGNGNNDSAPNSDDYVGADGYASSRYVIAVGATGSNGVRSWYSEAGSAVLVNAPSNSSISGITTTDLMGSNGYASGNCTSTFGGTSSASPLVAGIVGLILDANPNLTWRDVQHILVNTADRTDTGDPNWRQNDSGRWISEYHGFGRVDAEEAVRRARGWTSVPAEQSYVGSVVNVNQGLVDGQATNYRSSTHNVSTSIRFVEHVEVVFNATHPFRGDIRVLLVAPSGTVSVLMMERFNDVGDNYSNWTFTSSHLWGEDPNGTWTLLVSDAFSGGGSTGTFNNWQIKVYGTTTDPLNRITNGAFSQPIGDGGVMNWGVFSSPGPLGSDMDYNAAGGVFEMRRKGSAVNAGVLQYTQLPIQNGEVVEVKFDASNTGTGGGARRRLSVIAWDQDFGDLRICTFWIPPNSGVHSYTMRFKTSRAWTGAMLHFYAATTSTDGYYRFDNVSMRLNRTTTSGATLCYDPMMPPAVAGADSANLLNNPSFAAPISGANGDWGTFPAGVIFNQTGNVFNYRRPPALDSTVVLQNTATAFPAGRRFETTFQLSNSTGTTQRVTILIHASDFSDLTACSFYVPSGGALDWYRIRGFASQAWGTASISFYLATTATSGFVSLDNVTLQSRPSLGIVGLECYDVGVAPAGESGLFLDPALAPTLEATATALPYVAPGMPGELPVIVAPAPTDEPPTDEGSVGE